MGWPISAFLGAVFFFVRTNVLISFLAGGPRPKKRPTAASSRGFLSKFALEATSLHGVSAYDDGDACQDNLQRYCLHKRTNSALAGWGQARKSAKNGLWRTPLPLSRPPFRKKLKCD
jgi:hypothetical protein